MRQLRSSPAPARLQPLPGSTPGQLEVTGTRYSCSIIDERPPQPGPAQSHQSERTECGALSNVGIQYLLILTFQLLEKVTNSYCAKGERARKVSAYCAYEIS